MKNNIQEKPLKNQKIVKKKIKTMRLRTLGKKIQKKTN